MNSYAVIAAYSCLVNIFLTALKYALGELSGSLALRADAIHSLSDVISSVTIFIGIVISNRKTQTFPEGLYKVENLVALISSAFIWYAAFEIVSDALSSAAPVHLENIPLVVAGIIVIIVITFAFSRYELRVGLQVGSPSLVADAKHVHSDLLSTVVILASVIGAQLGFLVDRYVAMFVAILVAKAAFQIMIDAVKVLLDATLDHATLDEIRKIMEGHPDVSEVVSVGGRNSGRYRFVEISLRMRTRLLREAHQIVSHLEEEILDRWPNIDKILIHYEPQPIQTWRIAVPLDEEEGKTPNEHSPISDHFGEALYFAILAKDMVTGDVHIESYVGNPLRTLERHKGVRVAEFLVEQGVDEVICRADLRGKGAGYALEALEVHFTRTKHKELSEVINQVSRES